MTSVVDGPRHTRLTWIIAALLALLMLLLWLTGHGPGSSAGCCGQQAAVTAPVAAAIPTASTPLMVTKPSEVVCGGGSISAQVTFASGSAELDAADKKMFDAIAPCLSSGRYEIGGHTDSTAGDDVNIPLSQRRAEAVKNYLVTKSGVTATNLTAVGYGSANPVADNATEEGKARNRRIEFDKK